VNPPAVTREALDAFERQSGLPDVARFLIETGRVIVTPSRGEQMRNDNVLSSHI